MVVREILGIVESLQTASCGPNGKSPVGDFGLISCANTVHIRHMPFFDPRVILVLSGSKVVFEGDNAIRCEAGSALTIPAPSSYDLRDEPDPESRRYRALIIPFKPELLERLQQIHGITRDTQGDAGVLKFEQDQTLLSSVKHYLTSIDNAQLAAHRLTEILLVLVGMNPGLLSYTLKADRWSQRVRAVLATDLTRSWDTQEVCKRLTTTESTLRRHLKEEKTGFRELLYELRLSTALMKLLQTSLPVGHIAYDCGYQSLSRFSSNFHKRFGLPPTQMRESLSESEQRMTVSGQPASL